MPWWKEQPNWWFFTSLTAYYLYNKKLNLRNEIKNISSNLYKFPFAYEHNKAIFHNYKSTFVTTAAMSVSIWIHFMFILPPKVRRSKLITQLSETQNKP